MARPSCLRLLPHLSRLAASRTFCTAGRRRPIRTAMMAITTRSSMSVKAGRRRMAGLLSGTGGGRAGSLAGPTRIQRTQGSIHLEVERVLALGLNLGGEGRPGVVLGLDTVLGHREVAGQGVRVRHLVLR